MHAASQSTLFRRQLALTSVCRLVALRSEQFSSDTRSAIFPKIRAGSIVTASSCPRDMGVCFSTAGCTSLDMTCRSRRSKNSGKSTAKLPGTLNLERRRESRQLPVHWARGWVTPSEWQLLRRWLRLDLTRRSRQFLTTKSSVSRETAACRKALDRKSVV